MTERRRAYPFHEIEPKWQLRWETEGVFQAANPGQPGSEKPKLYILDMFPYPSGAGLHVGHPEGYTATDIVSRFKRMRGYNVLHPMGWDAFGLPAEQYAVQTGTHPRDTTRRNIETFRRQIKALGFSYDWSREIDTTDPRYYKWTQWIFMQLYRRDLAYVSEAPVWYCPELGTVLANEEVLNTPDGPRSERGNHPVERRPFRQWMLRITAYAERLLKDLDDLDWPESLKEMQRNWIGRSEGAMVTFDLPDADVEIEVFTTRPDTLFGATYMVLAPEHPLVSKITTDSQRTEVEAYITKVSAKTDLERTDLAKEKTGCFTGAYAVNPVNSERIPVWIADYVLVSYGTGAIMAVPAHDERDYEFARQFDLPIIEVVERCGVEDGLEAHATGDTHATCYSGEGRNVNSGFLDGLPTAEAKEKITVWLEEKGLGRREVQYKLRDWLFSRQRYWGEPFPVVWEGKDHRLVDESELPVELPEMEDFRPSPEGLAPLAKAGDWVNRSDGTRREINTMPQWAGSCWYYLRYLDPHNDQALVDPEVERYWMQPFGVDLYVGGAEHAVLHLLYARFWHKVLFDLGVVSTPEPFHRLVNQGLILGEDGQKMSKSRGNVVNPDEVIEAYGADAMRLFEMFMGPLEQAKPWSMTGVEGVYRFLARVWRLIMAEDQEGQWGLSSKIKDVEPSRDELRVVHASIKKVTADLETLSFNTAIAELMKFVNRFTQAGVVPLSALRILLKLLNPFAPHLAEELWERLNEKFDDAEGFLAWQPWPVHDESVLEQTEVELVVQVNGKVRDKIRIARDAEEETVRQTALASEKTLKFVEGKTVRKVIVVPGRLVNVVAN